MQVGDKVKLSTTWLRSISCYTGDLPFAKGKITGIKALSPDCVLATIDWGNKDIPEKVNIKNLQKCK